MDESIKQDQSEIMQLWEQLSELVLRARLMKDTANANEALQYYEKSDTSSPLAPALRLWLGDNLIYDLRFQDASQVYADLVERYPDRETGTTEGLTFAAVALEQQAVCYERLGQLERSIEAYQRIQKSFSKGVSAAWLHFRIGQLAESMDKDADAIAAYRAAAESQDEPHNTDWSIPDLARRQADRLEQSRQFSTSAEELAVLLARALERKDTDALADLASPTHFSLGFVCSEQVFVAREEVLPFLTSDLKQSEIRLDPMALAGNGGKRYLLIEGWKGQLLVDRVFFQLTQTKAGWEWSGIVLSRLGESWSKIFPPVPPVSNQPLEIPIKAPWRRGDDWRAGGLNRFIESFAPFVGGFVFLEDVFSGCGYGPGGFYYNQGTTHLGQDAFSIDFTRYAQGLPYFFDSDNKEVLAIQQGVVALVRNFVRGGDPNLDNRVELTHAGLRDFAQPIGTPASAIRPLKYRSKYLHLDGPFRIFLSLGMLIRQGTRLGFTDDTGNSAFPHLHFSIHDRDVMVAGVGFGSVRPPPMDGRVLGDSNGGSCVSSSNFPFP